MSCCGGNCSCGKGDKLSVQKKITLVQMSAQQGELTIHDWMKGMGSLKIEEEIAEIRFKNKRKAFYRNRSGLSLAKDDRVVVEVEGGHDVGTVTLTGQPAEKQFEQAGINRDKSALNKIYRKCTQKDIDRWLESKRRERDVLLLARQMAVEQDLQLSISDVEFQGDGRKAMVYASTDDHIDPDKLLRRMAIQFGVNVELELNSSSRTSIRRMYHA